MHPVSPSLGCAMPSSASCAAASNVISATPQPARVVVPFSSTSVIRTRWRAGRHPTPRR